MKLGRWELVVMQSRQRRLGPVSVHDGKIGIVDLGSVSFPWSALVLVVISSSYSPDSPDSPVK